jgi:NAD(P)-dependent dehydrogenase (short-subunit alcohol dehydrogenase family)
VIAKDGEPGSLDLYETVVRINLIGSFNVLRLAAAAMAKGREIDEERGAIILTASVSAFEGQIGQIPYASSKAGVVGMTIVAARDLAGRKIRVCTIAPGTFDSLTRRFCRHSAHKCENPLPKRCRIPPASDAQRSSARFCFQK